MRNRRDYLFIVFALASFGAAIYHLIKIFIGHDDSPTWRHLLFFVTGSLCSWLFLKRPTFFVFLFTILLVQQYYSHGSYLIKLWEKENKIHWISVAVLLYLPFALILLILDYKAKKARRTL